MEYLSPEPTLDNTVYEIIYDQLRLMNRDMLFYKEVLLEALEKVVEVIL